MREIVILQSLHKITFDDKLDKITAALKERQINILPIELRHAKELEKRPSLEINGRVHLDPFDRMLIAQSIAQKYTIISSDRKYPSYRSHGLRLLVNEN